MEEITLNKAGIPCMHTNYTIMPFSSWRALEAFALEVRRIKPNGSVTAANNNFKAFVNNNMLSKPQAYGIRGGNGVYKSPRNYDEAIARNKFVYYEEYKEIKRKIEKQITDGLQKSSIAEAMRPKLVYNDKEIGEFIFDKAAMSLKPEIYFYCPSKKREVLPATEDIIYDGDKMSLGDKSKVVYALKVTTPNGDIEFVELSDDALEIANEKGIVSCTSNNKKVYLYKQKKPKAYNAVKIIVGLTAGGFTSWENDFYTGLTACIVMDVLENLGYSVSIEVAMGGGRCSGCHGLGRSLTFNGRRTYGRRYFTYTAKGFDEAADMDGLLYTLCDPSFHNVKFISLINDFFNFFGDVIDTSGNPAMYWHGIEEPDMVNPIGLYSLLREKKKGNESLMTYYIHRVKNETDVSRMVLDLVLTCENKNMEALKIYQNHDFGTDK